MMSQRIKKIGADLALFLGALLLIGLVLEIVVRVFYGDPSPRTHRLLTEYDSLLGWRKIPHVTGEHVTSEYAISEKMNSKGIRGPEYSYEKHPNEYRILVLGDSFAEGYTVEFHELFSEVLKAKLNENKSSRYYEVINIGTGGYSTDQEFLLFQTEGKKYAPDLTILMFYDNDVWYNNQARYWRGYKPRFQLNADGTIFLTKVPVPKPDRASKQHLPEIPLLNSATTWLSSHLYLFRFVQSRVQNPPHPDTNTTPYDLPSTTHADQGISSIPSEFRVYKKQVNADVALAWKITEAILLNLREEMTSIRSELLVFYVPIRASVYLEEWNKMKKQYGLSDEDWTIEQVNNELSAICQRNHIEGVFPLGAFRAEANKLRTAGKRLYFVTDDHWNADGHRCVGEMLARLIRDTYLVDAPNDKPEYAEAPEAIKP